MLIALLVPLAIAVVFYTVVLLRAALKRRATPNLEAVALGAVANFFDTLGIGSFAPTMAWFKLRKMVPDRLIPCVMIVGYSLPAMAQAVIFLIILGVSVDPVLLAGCVVATMLGALLGAPLVVRSPVRLVQVVVGLGLLCAAAFYTLVNLKLMPGGGTASALPLPLMLAAIAANFGFGVLLNFGVGNYAPTLAMFSLMGMDPRLCFPIMAGGAAMAAAGAGARHISIGKVDLRIAIGLTLGGIPAVFIAAFVVKSMPVETLRWLVVVVVVYAALVIFRAAASRTQPALTPEEAVAPLSPGSP
jgi:uncharacterized membrane protein YfcA